MNEIDRVARAVHEELSHINIMAYLDMPTDTAERVATAAIAAMRGEPVGWQPIETAPKDGQMFMFWALGKIGIGSIEPREYQGSKFFVKQAALAGPDEHNDSKAGIALSYSFLDHATHWMPLPTPPDSGKD